MTKEEFISGYCTRSGVSREFFDEHLVAMECACNEDSCQGWVAVGNDPIHINIHLDLYAPRGAESKEGD